MGGPIASQRPRHTDDLQGRRQTIPRDRRRRPSRNFRRAVRKFASRFRPSVASSLTDRTKLRLEHKCSYRKGEAPRSAAFYPRKSLLRQSSADEPKLPARLDSHSARRSFCPPRGGRILPRCPGMLLEILPEMPVVLELIGYRGLGSSRPHAVEVKKRGIAQCFSRSIVDEVPHLCVKAKAVARDLTEKSPQRRATAPSIPNYRFHRECSWHLTGSSLSSTKGRDAVAVQEGMNAHF
jgi:hypothetical protein